MLYLVIAARFFMAAVDRRKALVFSLVLLAALLATGATVISLMAYFHWKEERSSCKENLDQVGINRVAESALKKTARDIQALLQADPEVKDNELWDISVRAEGRTLSYTHRLKKPVNMGAFHRFVSEHQKELFEERCSDDNEFLIAIKATETHTFYSSEGERLTSFSIDRADCPQW